MPAKKPKRPQKAAPSDKAYEYPKVTDGSQLAAEIREESNSLTEKQRSELFRQGMQIVYGGSGRKQKQKTRARR